MSNIFDVAAYILSKQGTMTTLKLQKLVYYAQAWSLVWDEKPLFEERIEAWANGPVAPVLYAWHRGQYEVSSCPRGNPDALTSSERETVDAVLEYYGGRTSRWLSDLTHKERPWREARADLQPGERGNTEISHAAMAEYYDAL